MPTTAPLLFKRNKLILNILTLDFFYGAPTIHTDPSVTFVRPAIWKDVTHVPRPNLYVQNKESS
jgi:hypothetical protein